MNSENEKQEDTFFKKVKKGTTEGFSKMGEATGKFFKTIGKKWSENIENIKKKWDKNIKKMKKQQRVELIRKFRRTPEYKYMREIDKKIKHVDSEAKKIKQDTTKIKEDTSQLLLTSAQIFDVLENINYKTDNIEKSISPMLPLLEQILSNIDDMEDYMKQNLGSKWAKLKNHWDLCKDGKITRKDFILRGFSTLGSTFLGVFK